MENGRVKSMARECIGMDGMNNIFWPVKTETVLMHNDVTEEKQEED